MAKIKKLTAIVAMLVLGTLAIIYGVRGFLVDLTPSIQGIIGIAIAAILVFEVGIKTVTNFSKLKKIGNQQIISLTIALIVLLTGVGLLFGFQIPILSVVANGSFLTGGVFVILEAVTF